MKSLKTCLRYPGGKSRAVTKMDPYFPDLRNYKEFREPFLGGGSVAIYITKKYPDLTIWANDLYEPLVNFWQQLQMFGTDLKNALSDLKSSHNDPVSAKILFLSSKVKVGDISVNNFDRAVAFYIVNKCSFSGLTESSSFSPQASNANFSMRGIEKLPDYSQLISKWRITNYSYDYMMDGNRNVFMYLDPPYDIKDNLYGNKGSMHKGFDHDKFAVDCDNNNMDQLISYNSDQLVKDRFKNWNAAEFDLTYTMRSVGEYMRDQKQRKELLLFNYNKNPKIQFAFDGCYNY
ncbi:DNA adenine methylase, partial [bacterium]|nr:DNA adenine methylase [bacterium]